MKSQPTIPSSGERGIALIVVLLLMAVLSGLATGFAMTGNIEVQMGTNEVYYAGARAAAEAGLNRAIVEILADTTTNFLSGADGVVDAGNATAAVNADNGKLTFLLGGVAGPYALDANGQYTYDIEILDDDDDDLYATPLTTAQVTAMGEDDSDYTNANDRLILRAIGYGPNGTIVRLARVLDTVDTTTVSTTPSSAFDAAIIVDGDLSLSGTATISGINTATAGSGTVHANGNLVVSGTVNVTGDATASGTYSATGSWAPGGQSGGGTPTVNLPDVHASDYESLATHKLTLVGGSPQIQTRVGGVWTNCPSCSIGWSYSASQGQWQTSNTPSDAIIYAEGNVDIGGTSGSTVRNLSVFATGNIKVHGNAKLGPNSAANAMQFVTDGDLMIDNGSDIDPPSLTDGQILVRGQIDIGGSTEFQGRIIVQNEAVGSLVTSNSIHGTPTIRYAGSLPDVSTVPVTTTGPTTYVNNVSGWMEQ